MKTVAKVVLDRTVLIITSILLCIVLWTVSIAVIASSASLESRWYVVYKILPVLHIKDTVGYFIPKGSEVRAVAIGTVVFFAPENYNDKDTILHENTHVKQFYRMGGVPFIILGITSNKFRVIMEYEAYNAESVPITIGEIALNAALTPETDQWPIERFNELRAKNLAILETMVDGRKVFAAKK